MRSRLFRGIVLVLLAVAPFCASAPVSSDVEGARVLLDAAEDKVRGRKYEEALILLRKAADEDASLLEIHYVEGQVHEKLKAPGAALAAYRRFLEIYADKAGRGDATKDDTKRKAKVSKRVDVLAAGERDLAKLEDRFAEDLLALARKHRDGALSIARQALEMILEIRPAHAEAVALYVELGGEPPANAAAAAGGKTPFDRWSYASTTDLIAERSLGSPASLSYPEDVLKVVTDESGTIIQPTEVVATAEEYTYHASFRMTHTMSSRWLTGLVFGVSGGGLTRFFAAFVKSDRLILHHVDQPRSMREDVAVQRIPTIRPDTWHDLLVHVKGQKIEVLVDGKKVVNYTAPRDHDLNGGVGLWQQSSESEYRALRVGRMESP